MYLLEVVSNLKLVLGISHVGLDLRVGVVDNSQEHVDEDKEDKEDKQHEEDWTQDTIGLLQLVEVKITQDNPEQSKAGKRKLINDYTKEKSQTNKLQSIKCPTIHA